MNKKVISIFLLALAVLLVGCGNDKNEATNDSFLYEDTEKGISILETQGWTVEKQTDTSVKLSNEKVVAVITVVPKDKTAEEIMRELKKGAGQISIIEESDQSISWKSEKKESIRTDVLIEERKERTFVMTIITPQNTYETKQKHIEEIKNNIELN